MAFAEFKLGLLPGPALGRLEHVEQLAGGRLGKSRLGSERVFLVAHPPDPAVVQVACRVTKVVVLMADDIVVKIGDIDRAIRPHANVDRAKLAVAGLEHRIPPVELEAGSLRPQRKTFHGVGLEIVDHELAAHRLRHVAAVDHLDPAVAARVADAAESESFLCRDGGRGKVGHTSGTIHHERLAPVIEHYSPRIARPHEIV